MKNKLKLLLITLLISNLLIGQAFASIVNTNLSLSNDAEQSNDIEQSNDAEQSNDVDTLLVTPVDTDVTFWNTASGLAQSRFPFASKCLQHSAGPIRHIGTSYTPSTLTFSSTSSESKKIQSTNGWSSVVSQAKDYFNNKTGSLSKTFYASVESNDNEDVYLALHNFTVTASVTNKSLNGNYTINFDIYDWYDFDEPQGEYLNKTRILVGLAYSSQKLGTLKNYAIKINGIKVNATSSNSSSSGNSNGSYSRVLKVTSPLMYGADIKNVQSRLNSLGYNAGTADGYYGNNTKNAVISFQKANGLTADGEVGPATWNKLFSNNSGGSSNSGYSRILKVTSPLMYGTDIKNVQSRLNSLGYNAGTADGYYGNNTKNAVISFQKANGLTADGEVGPATWNKLFG